MPLIPSILNALPINEMKKKIAENGLACVFYAGLDLNQNIASEDKEKRQRGIAQLKKCVDVVKEFDGDVLSGMIYGVWGGFSGNAPTGDELNWPAESIGKVAEYAQQDQVKLALEPVSRFEGYLLATVQDGLEYLQKVGCDNVGLHLDTFQMNIEEKDLPSAIRCAGDKVLHFHICASDRGVPGIGYIDWKGCSRHYKRSGIRAG